MLLQAERIAFVVPRYYISVHNVTKGGVILTRRPVARKEVEYIEIVGARAFLLWQSRGVVMILLSLALAASAYVTLGVPRLVRAFLSTGGANFGSMLGFHVSIQV